jgi:sugar-phosphatase
MSTAMRSFRVDGILFDNDGVLVDSHEAAAAVWNEWARTWCPGFDFHRDIQHGKRVIDVVAELVEPAALPAAAQVLIDMEMASATRVPAVPGAAELVSSIPPHLWAVVTSGRRDMALARLVSAGLPTPHVIIAAEDVHAGKPAPDPYLAAAEALQIAPEACAVFEDAPSGVTAARAAGAKVVIGVGPATVGHDVDISVPDLTNITFDGCHLVVATPGIGAA